MDLGWVDSCEFPGVLAKALEIGGWSTGIDLRNAVDNPELHWPVQES
jgi:hypothetical protein